MSLFAKPLDKGMVLVSELYIYPLKSAQGIAVDSLTLDQRGPLFDRQWMVVDLKGKFLTQRILPKMCLIEVNINDGRLQLTAPAMPTIEVPPFELQPVATRDVIVWKDAVRAQDCGDSVADWLTQFLGKICRLVEMPPNCRRLVDSKYATGDETVSFADGFPLLVLSQASLDDFNSKLTAPVSMNRFRPNIVIDGCEAYAEDRWAESDATKHIKIGDISMSLVKPCSRCIIPSIDQASGEKQMEVNDALLAHRRRGSEVYFGQNAIHRQSGALSIGDPVMLSP